MRIINGFYTLVRELMMMSNQQLAQCLLLPFAYFVNTLSHFYQSNPSVAHPSDGNAGLETVRRADEVVVVVTKAVDLTCGCIGAYKAENNPVHISDFTSNLYWLEPNRRFISAFAL
jgi:hypothetical protein